MCDVIVQYRVQPTGPETIAIRRLEPVERGVVQPVCVAYSIVAQAYTEFAELRTIRNTRPVWPDILGQEVVATKVLYAFSQFQQPGPTIRGDAHTESVVIQHLHPEVRKRFMKVHRNQPEVPHILIGRIHGR